MGNSRFKFRLWDNDNECYDYIDFRDLSRTNEILTIYEDYFYDGYFERNQDCIEQCTGLKDKNGNLIYIGDIIKCGNGPLNTATVQYENGENFIDGIYPFNLYHDCGDECHCQLRDYPEYACEIIGNVHQTKDNE